MASWRWARVAASQSARSAIVWANTVSRCRLLPGAEDCDEGGAGGADVGAL
jgi:hypothetical protein